MANEPQTTVSERELAAILGTGVNEDGPVSLSASDSSDDPPPTAADAGGKPTATLPPVVQQPAAPPFVVTSKANKQHLELLRAGVHPRDIPHIKMGVQRGCQCVECKESRGEMEPPYYVPTGVQDPAAKAIRNVVTADVAKVILDAPNRAGRIVTMALHAPNEVVDLWKTPEDEQELLGELGKAVWDQYANVPEFKHRELWTLGVYMGTQFSIRLGASIVMFKAMKKG